MRCSWLIAVVGSRAPLMPSGWAILGDISANDVTQALPYLLKILENMRQLEAEWQSAERGDDALALA
jgi:hypothetical protein